MKPKSILLLIVFVLCNLMLYGQRLSPRMVINYKEREQMPRADINDITPFSNTIKFNKGDTIVELRTPPIGDQGSQGSCTGWAFGYGCASIQAYNVYQDWNWARRSPSFLFNQKNVSCTTAHSDSITWLMYTHGVCSYTLMPYDENDCITMPDSIQYMDAALNKSLRSYISDSSDIAEYKQFLKIGHPIGVVTNYARDLKRVWNTTSLNGKWASIAISTTDSAHAMCMVGYNDSIDAFKLMNSWDSIKGDRGFVWVSYNLVRNGVFNVAYVFESRGNGFVPIIEGPDYICDTTCFSVKNVPEGATYSWTYTKPDQYFGNHTMHGQGTSSVCLTLDSPPTPMSLGKGENYSLSGIIIPPHPVMPGSIEVVVSYGEASYSISKTIRKPKGSTPQVSVSDTAHVWPWRTYRTFSVTNCTHEPDSVFEWTVTRNAQIIPTAGTIGKTFTYRPTSNGVYTITVTNRQKECGKESTSMEFNVIRQFLQSPNMNNGTYTYELWHSIYGLLRTQNIQSADEQIDTSGLPQGLYIIITKENGQPIKQTKIMIQ